MKSGESKMETTENPVERAMSLFQEYTSVRTAAIAELRGRKAEIDKQLSVLEGGVGGGVKRSGQQKNPCKICGAWDHDARDKRHRDPKHPYGAGIGKVKKR